MVCTGGSGRINYHNVNDEFGLYKSIYGTGLLLFGAELNSSTKTFKIMKTDGSMQIVDTELAVLPYSSNYGGVYPVTCHVGQLGDIDLGDLFFADKVQYSSSGVKITIADAKNGTFGGNTQLTGVSSNYTLVGTAYCPLSWREPNYADVYNYGFKFGPFALNSYSKENGGFTFRMSRCV